MIEVDRLTKRFGSITAVDDVSFTVRPGHVTGFLGRNGAAKATALRLIVGLGTPTPGRTLIGGRPYASLVRPLHQAGVLLDASAVHPGRTTWQHALSVARSNGIGRQRVSEVLRLTGAEAALDYGLIDQILSDRSA